LKKGAQIASQMKERCYGEIEKENLGEKVKEDFALLKREVKKL